MMLNDFAAMISKIGLTLIAVSVPIVLFPTIKHIPKQKITKNVKEQILKNGLVHFTYKEQVASILEKGIQPDNTRKMSVFEKDLIWLYYLTKKSDILDRYKRVKKTRPNYDAAILVQNIQDSDIKRMKTHSAKPYVVVCKGSLKTTSMQFIKMTE